MKLCDKTVIIFGGTGLLGQSLTKALRDVGAKAIALSSQDCDLLDFTTCETVLNNTNPDLIINAAAYTQVDLAEDEEELAVILNSTIPPRLAEEAKKRRIPFLHYSTDFVFRGDKRKPYTVDDAPGAISVYGSSKEKGEKNLLALGYDRTLIVRISWLYGPGKTNFVEKILNLARERNHLTVVNDQTGSPSYAPDVATNSIRLLEHDTTGLFHLANSGETTWYGLASAAVELAHIDCTIEPVPSSAYPTRAVRPQYSVLDLSRFIETTQETPRHWREALQEYIERLKTATS